MRHKGPSYLSCLMLHDETFHIRVSIRSVCKSHPIVLYRQSPLILRLHISAVALSPLDFLTLLSPSTKHLSETSRAHSAIFSLNMNSLNIDRATEALKLLSAYESFQQAAHWGPRRCVLEALDVRIGV